MFEKPLLSPIAPLMLPQEHKPLLKIDMLREDLLHAEVSGNKWRKLKYNFIDAAQKGFTKILTFGGAYSNHIAATAACAHIHGFESIGIIRGEELNESSNHTLKLAHSKGMKLIFIDRQSYRKKDNINFIENYLTNPSKYYIIPEGGSNELAIKGTREILDQRTEKYDFVCVSAGTGGTAAGIIASARPNQKVLVYSALKGDFLKKEISTKLQMIGFENNNWELITDYHFGGYAKWNDELINFINQFKKINQIPLDPIYNGKMLFGLHDMIKSNYFEPKTGIITIHTGGTQAVVGFNEKNNGILK